MIRNGLILLSFSWIQLIVSAQNKLETTPVFPSYETVLSYLDKEIFSVTNEARIEVSKQKQGYFMQLTPYGSETEALYSQKIWDAKTGDFLKINASSFLNQASFSNGNLNLKSLLVNKSRFDLMLYYGYPNWSIDTKEVLEKKPNKTARELEILARTYSEEANAIIHPMQLRNNFPFTANFPAEKYAKISSERIELFQNRADKCIATWKQLKLKEPNYKVSIIGNLEVKIANDLMDFYGLMLSVQEEKHAQKYLDQVSYPDWMLQFGKIYLDDCPPNSFFFSDGDNDTYPLLFLQAKENYRKDVSVWNLSLMQLGWYVNMQAKLHASKLSYTASEIDAMTFLYALQDGEISDLTSLEEKLKLEAMKLERNESNEYTAIHIAPSMQLSIFGNPFDSESKLYYQNLAEFILFDLFKNYPTQDFCFSSDQKIKDLRLKTYLESKGIIYWFTPQKVSKVEQTKRLRELITLTFSTSFQQMESAGKSYVFRLLEQIQNIDLSEAENIALKKQFLARINPVDYLKAGDFSSFYFLSFGIETDYTFSKQENAFNTWRKNMKFDVENIEKTLYDLEVYVYYMSQTRSDFSPKEVEFVKAIYLQLSTEIDSKKWNSEKWTIEKMQGIQEDLLKL